MTALDSEDDHHAEDDNLNESESDDGETMDTDDVDNLGNDSAQAAFRVKSPPLIISATSSKGVPEFRSDTWGRGGV